MEKKNYIIAGLVLVVIVMLYLNKITSNKLASKSITIEAAMDTLHQYKTQLGNQGAYIATITGNRNDILSVLNIKAKDNTHLKSIIDSLKKDKTIQSASVVTTENKIKYVHDVDTIYKNVIIEDSITTKWWDAKVSVKNSKLGVSVTTRDEINLTTKLKDNRGWFTGKTLTTYATSANKETNITGLTSISTVVDQRKPRLGLFAGPAIIITKQGNASLGGAVGIGITF